MKNRYSFITVAALAFSLNAFTSAHAAQRTFTFTRIDKVSPGMLDRGRGSRYMVFIGGEARISGDYTEGTKYVGLFLEGMPDNTLRRTTIDGCTKAAHLVRLNPSQNLLEVIVQARGGLPPREPRRSVGGSYPESYENNNVQRAGDFFYVNLDMLQVGPMVPSFPPLLLDPNQWTGVDCGVVTPR